MFTHAVPQMISPVGQLHTPPEHVAVPGHAWPQAPQFAGSIDSFTHAEPHTASPVGQLHLPLVQVAPVAHFVVHVPHAPVSLLRSRQPMAGPQST